MPVASVVLTTYERPRNLELVLAGYLRQTRRDFELVIADDGSGPATAEVVQRCAQAADFQVRHVWQPDEGHRRTVALNRGIEAARTPWIIFSDGDCIPPADFVATHLDAQRPKRMPIGGYYRVSQAQSEAADPEWVAAGGHERVCSDEQRRALLRRHWKNRWHIWTRKRRRPHNLGLNMALARDALVAVNGFDENFRGWGREDGDLRDRLKRIGVWPLSIWDRSAVAHLYHPVHATRHDLGAATAYARRRQVPVVAEQGIRKTAAPPT